MDMHDRTDWQLLREFVERDSERAFAEIVARHANLVYSAALRQTGEPESAREVAQAVFADLARKAATLSVDVVLAGWLFRGARFAALSYLRAERRRQARETQAMELQGANTAPEPEWRQLLPILDEAMAALDDPERDAVVLRFFDKRDLRTVGAAFGVSEDAAQKRVSRALEKLREFFLRRGVAISVGTLAAGLPVHAVQAAPAGLAASLSVGALAGVSVSTTGLAGTIATSKLKIVALFTGAAAGLLLLLWWLLRQNGSPPPAPRFAEPPRSPVIAAAVAAATNRAPRTGLSGQVFLRGTPAPEVTIAFDTLCAPLQPAPVLTRHYVVHTNGGLGNVFVYIKEGAPSAAGLPAPAPALLDNSNCLFQPYVLGVQVNQPIVIRNSDSFMHNAHATGRLNPGFNFALPSSGWTTTKSFATPEIFLPIKCDIHPWMFAYVCVATHPWFDVTDATGHFQFPYPLPPGTYTIAAVHGKAGEATLKHIIKAGETNVLISFFLNVKQP
jgi:RNA polymerase sigma factor (sigma-70 family)